MRERHAVRAVMLEPGGEILLMRFLGASRAVWITPGGGLEPGETPRAGLARELVEETARDGWQIGPEIWRRSVSVTLHGETVLQRERYYLVPTPRFPAPTWMPDPVERQVFGGFRWWSAAAIGLATDRFAPRRLSDCLTRLIECGPPGEPLEVGR